jgi:formamidopyrimidine-DNA glycosylase
MPELPEVEVTIRNLKKHLFQTQIIKVDVFYEKIVKDINLFKKICFKFFLDIQRKGKFLLFFLSKELVLVGHLRMEGKLYLNSLKEIPIDNDKHEHFRIFLSNNLVLRYYDFRKFGRFILYKKENYLKYSKLNELAEDPFEISKEKFYSRLNAKNIIIKNILLNQKIISGIGNIYASEILFLSKIHPETKASVLNFKQTSLILENAKKILKKAILFGGTSISTFEALGKKGSFQNQLLVYKQENKKCYFCQKKIEKKKLNNRSTYFCSQCQKFYKK